jgi:hypothetical protein
MHPWEHIPTQHQHDESPMRADAQQLMGPSARIHLPARGCERRIGSTNDNTGGIRRFADSSQRWSRRKGGMWRGLRVPHLLHQRFRLWRKEGTLHSKVTLPEAQVATTPLRCYSKGCVFQAEPAALCQPLVRIKISDPDPHCSP